MIENLWVKPKLVAVIVYLIPLLTMLTKAKGGVIPMQSGFVGPLCM